jgi:hypothetical protein
VAPRPLIGLLLLLSSLGAGPGAALAAECVGVDDFGGSPVGEFPLEWKPRKESGRPVYSVREEGGRRFLRGIARRIGIQAGREVAWNLEAYPILAWSWRPIEFPKESDVPAGTHLVSSGGNTQVRVLRHSAQAGQWVDEQVNVREDYQKYFGGSEVPKPGGIAVLTDSDDTKSSAQGDYANFRVCKP